LGDRSEGAETKKEQTTMKAKRQRHSAAYKAKVGLEALNGNKTVAEIARQYQVHPTQVSQWKSAVRERLPEVFERGATAQVEQAERQVARLEQKVGQLTMELDWLKKKSRQLEM
jgi:transposase